MATKELETDLKNDRTFESSLGSWRMPVLFTRCAQIVAAGLVSAGLPCLWVQVEIRCRSTRTHYLQKSAT